VNNLDFELEIGLDLGRKYPVTVLHSPAGEARIAMRFPLSLPSHNQEFIGGISRHFVIAKIC
jgi:hypothetical protein